MVGIAGGNYAGVRQPPYHPRLSCNRHRYCHHHRHRHRHRHRHCHHRTSPSPRLNIPVFLRESAAQQSIFVGFCPGCFLFLNGQFNGRFGFVVYTRGTRAASGGWQVGQNHFRAIIGVRSFTFWQLPKESVRPTIMTVTVTVTVSDLSRRIGIEWHRTGQVRTFKPFRGDLSVCRLIVLSRIIGYISTWITYAALGTTPSTTTTSADIPSSPTTWFDSIGFKSGVIQNRIPSPSVALHSTQAPLYPARRQEGVTLWVASQAALPPPAPQSNFPRRQEKERLTQQRQRIPTRGTGGRYRKEEKRKKTPEVLHVRIYVHI